MPRAAVLFFAAALCALVALVWMAGSGGEPQPRTADEGWTPEGVADETPGSGDETSPTPEAAPTETAEPAVPRVLPPDAALEDVRDALAAQDPVALTEAYERIARLASKGAGSLQALQRQIAKTDDPAVRGVALVATCRDESESALRFAAARLMKPKRRAAADVVGSFAALLIDGRGTGDALELGQLGHLPVQIGAVSSGTYARKAIVFFLDHTDTVGDEGEDVVELCVRSIQRSSSLATLLVDGDRKRAYVAALPESDWARIRAAALTHALPEETRAAFEK